jgi:uncharacterized protein YbjT (DUF2867 family)
MNKPRMLVTGASGFIGEEVSRQLAVAGYRPKLMIRRPLREVSIRDFDADFVEANLRNPESLTRAVDGVDCVLHLG